MWILKHKDNGDSYLTYDREARRKPGERGSWQYIGNQESPEMPQLIEINQSNDLVCCNDDEGGVRVFVCGE